MEQVKTDAKSASMPGDRALLFAVSVLSLFIEIMLIRHLGSEIRIFAYFKNLALIGAFLGLGFGYLYKPRVSPMVTVICMALIALATHPYSGFSGISEFLSLGDFNTWILVKIQAPLVILGMLLLTVLFFLVIISMIPLGQVLAGVFDRSSNRILDYSINIGGSLAGVWLFSLVSFMRLDPMVWYLVSALGIILLLIRKPKEAMGAVLAAVIMVVGLTGRQGMSEEVKWSPYQKITLEQMDIEYKYNGVDKSIIIRALNANSVIYLFMLDLSMQFRRGLPEFFSEKYDNYLYYDIPYRLPQKIDEVLVLGSGGGNDVAAALRAGAKHVTAVEIDPVIIEYGKRLHPEKPYDSPRVTIINNDGRNFIRNTDKKFDLIILGLLDSHTLTSNFSNTNLDSFLYTKQSIGEMKNRLNDSGVLALSFQVAFPWIGGKIFHMVRDQFGEDPDIIRFPSEGYRIITGTGGTYFIATKDRAALEKKKSEDPILGGIFQANKNLLGLFKSMDIRQQTDDWPYLYVKDAAIPRLHLLVSLVLLVIFLIMAIAVFGAPGKSDLHFAGLGAGFLLMEVAVISRFCLFWGATWIVSSIVISMILVAILLANSIHLARGKGFSYPVLYALIGISLAAVYLAPLSSGWMILLYLAPFVAIGMLFAKSFDSSQVPSKALAYNLFGSLVGGMSESLSFITGISALILVGIGFYAFSAIFAGAVGRK
ncbi:MAG: methyltransferase domain-containing protein [Nitrospinota bacterium]|nr:methyltransferase domain-containing protein [Nitrospinota bacterium]